MNKWLKRIGFTVLVLFVLLNVMTVFQAYKFTHFYDNVPALKKPEEMSAGEKASAIFFGVKYPKKKNEDSLLLPHEFVSFKTEDSLKLEAWYLDSQKDDTVKPHIGTVIMFHGHGSCKSAIIKEASAFYEMGWDVLMVDFRAHGNSDGNICTIGYNESKDVKAAYDFIHSKKEKNIVLWGISLGASTILKAMNDYTIKPSKIILEMPFGSLLDAAEGRLRTMHLPAEPLAVFLTFWGGIEQGYWAFNHKPWDYAAKVNCPVLLQWGINDPRVTEEETNHIFKNLSSHQKTLIKYVHCGHESLYKKETEKWNKTVGDFLKQ
jgi:hypothetical protein